MARQIVLCNGRGDRFILSTVAGVISAHGALEFWKLSHHVGQQIRFAQLSGTTGYIPVQLQPVFQIRRQVRHATGPVEHAAQPFLEDHSFEFGNPVTESYLGVLCPEEIGIREPRMHNPLVAPADLIRLFALEIADGDEMG